LSSVASVSLLPKTVALSLETDPVGLPVSLDLDSGPAPLTRTVIVGSSHSVAVAATQALNGVVYQFDSWSDGGAPSHQIVAPATASTYRARYRAHAELSVRQAASTDAPSIDRPFDFLVDVSNSGPNPAPSVVVSDTLPAGARFVTAAGDGWSCSEAAGVVTCNRSTLAVGIAPRLTIAVLAPSVKGEVTNSVSVRSDLFDSSPADDSSDLVVRIGLHRFHTLAPCRLVDTRESGPALAAGTERTFTLPGLCGIPSSSRALSLNVTVTEGSAAGDLRLAPAGLTPETSSINYGAGQTRAALAVVALSESGEVSVRCGQATGIVHLILDVTGYFE
jgi:uncharacterized repeat protein (TIGR01451 family)